MPAFYITTNTVGVNSSRRPELYLPAKMSAERRARNEAAAAKMTDEMALDELREVRDLTPEQLAQLLRVNQAAVSKMERRADMYITTLQGVIKAMGAEPFSFLALIASLWHLQDG